MSASFNWVDYTVVGLFIASILAGLMRGAIKEVLSVVSWIVAFIVASLFASPIAQSFTSSGNVQSAVEATSKTIGINATQPISYAAVGLSFVCLFILTMIVGSIVSYLVSGAVEATGVSVINRLGGALFGLARGFLVTLLIIFLVQLTPIRAEAWWTSSLFVASFQPAVVWLADRVSPGLEGLKAKMSDTLQGVDSQPYIQNLKSTYEGFDQKKQ